MIISDVIGVRRNVGDLHVFMAKTTGKYVKKRDITLVDLFHVIRKYKNIWSLGRKNKTKNVYL